MHKSLQLLQHKDAEVFRKIAIHVSIFCLFLIDFLPLRRLTYIPKESNFRLSGNYQ